MKQLLFLSCSLFCFLFSTSSYAAVVNNNLSSSSIELVLENTHPVKPLGKKEAKKNKERPTNTKGKASAKHIIFGVLLTIIGLGALVLAVLFTGTSELKLAIVLYGVAIFFIGFGLLYIIKNKSFVN